MKKTILFAILGLYNSIVLAQDNWCTSKLSLDKKSIYQSLAYIPNSENQKKRSEETINLAISINAFGTSEGEEFLTTQEITDAIAELNMAFEETKIQFFILGEINFVSSNRLYFFDVKEGSEDFNEIENLYDIDGAINLYLVGPVSEGLNPLIGWCGVSYFPFENTDRLILANSCFSGGLLAHEMGHFFSLWHTHEQAFGKELVDGSNCHVAGDELCDTPADPGISKLNVNDACEYFGSTKDENGDFFKPNTSNFMSYAPASCPDEFSPTQITRIYETYHMAKSHLMTTPYQAIFSTQESSVCTDQTVNFVNQSIDAVSYFWEFDGGIPATSHEESPAVIYTTLGQYEVSLTITNSNGLKDKMTQTNAIQVLESTSSQTTNLAGSFEETDLRELIYNPDYRGTFKLTDLASSDGEQSVWMNYYEYDESVGATDYLILGTINPSLQTSCHLSFDYAYAMFDSLNYDSLEVVYRASCGSWQTLWSKAGAALQTASAENSDIFIPSTEEWQTIIVPLAFDPDLESVEIAFRATNGWGNSLFIDRYFTTSAPLTPIIQRNDQELTIEEHGYDMQWYLNGIAIEGATEASITIIEDGEYHVVVSNGHCDSTSDPLALSNVLYATPQSGEIILYPNPVKDVLFISYFKSASHENIRMTIRNLSGKTISSEVLKQQIDLSFLPSGLYILELFDGKESSHQKFFKE